MENRVIKFRSWNYLKKKMRYKDIHEIASGYLGINLDEKYLMQFTGLLDKNGKEIYEKDIISYKHHKGYLLKDFISEVIWDNNYSCFGYIDYDTGISCPFAEFDEVETDLLKHTEVIGNVFENPELIIKKNV